MRRRAIDPSDPALPEGAEPLSAQVMAPPELARRLSQIGVVSRADGLRLAFLFFISLRPQEPWWLLLLLAVPVLFWTSWRTLVALGPTRRWLVLGVTAQSITTHWIRIGGSVGMRGGYSLDLSER